MDILTMAVLAAAIATGAADAQPEGEWRPPFLRVWEHLEGFNGAARDLHAQRKAFQLGRIQRLESDRHLSGGVSATTPGNDGKILAATASFSQNDWGVEIGAETGDGWESSSVGIFRDLHSARARLLRFLSRMKDLQAGLDDLDLERKVFSDWKGIVLDKIRYDGVQREIRARQACLSGLEPVEKVLALLLAEGKIPEGTADLIALFRMENEIRLDILSAQSGLLLAGLRRGFRIDSALFLDLLPDSLLADGRVAAPGGSPTYDRRIDSLRGTIEFEQERFNAARVSPIRMGAGIDFGDFSGREEVTPYLKVSFDLSWSAAGELRMRGPALRPLPSMPRADTLEQGHGNGRAASFNAKADKLVAGSLEKIRYGRPESAFETHDALQRKLGIELAFIQLRQSELETRLEALENKADLPFHVRAEK